MSSSEERTLGCSDLRSDWLRRVSLPQRGIISIENRIPPVSPIARGAFISALFRIPCGELGTRRDAVSLLI
jgi:hypothetical protein